MRHFQTLTACVVACGVVLGIPSTGSGQASPKSGSVSAAAEVGVRTFTTEPSALDRGKFEEYRSLPAGMLLERLKLIYTPADSFGTYQLTYRRPGDTDQNLWLQAKRPGLYDFDLSWSRFQHLYSSDARSPGAENVVPGFNTLPVPRPDSTAWRNAPYIGNVRSVWDPMKMSLGITPTSALDFKAEYIHTAKKGGIPQSISFNGSSGPQREFVSPIDQTTSDIRLAQSFSAAKGPDGILGKVIKSYQFTVSYDYSRFQNAVKSVMVDNPMQAVSSPTLGAASSLVSLAPDNTAHAATIVGALSLPYKTRVTGSVSGSWQYQNDPFFAQTNNDSLKSNVNYGLVSNARASLDGKVKQSTVNFSATSRPFAGLTLAARYRNHSYDNSTAQFHIKALVVSDRSFALADSLYTEVVPYNKINTEVSATYELVRSLALAIGYSVEDWNRNVDERNAQTTREKTPRISLDYNGLDWISLHASYSAGERRYGWYTESGTEILGFRRFDISNRDRKRLNFLATVTPIDELTVALTYQTGDDQFPGAQYGTASDKSTMTGVDVDWTPNKRVGVSVGYSNENIDNILNMRVRTGAVGSATYDNPTYKWTNTNSDKSTTTFVSVNAVLIPDVLDMTASASSTEGHFWVYNRNAAAPTGGTAAQNLTATAEDWPEVSQKLQPMALALRYRMDENWAFTLRYQGETYKQNDFRTLAPVFTTTTLAGGPVATNFSGNLPGNIGATSGTNTGQYHFLGNNYNPYTANWLTFTVSWHPSALPLETGRPTF